MRNDNFTYSDIQSLSGDLNYIISHIEPQAVKGKGLCYVCDVCQESIKISETGQSTDLLILHYVIHHPEHKIKNKSALQYISKQNRPPILLLPNDNYEALAVLKEYRGESNDSPAI